MRKPTLEDPVTVTEVADSDVIIEDARLFVVMMAGAIANCVGNEYVAVPVR